MSGEHLQHAYLLFNQQRYGDAERAVRAHLNGDPQDANAMHLLGVTQLALGRVAEARDTAQGALGLAPADADLHDLLARIELHAEEWAKAEEHAQRAVELDPGRSTHHATLAMVLISRNKAERALAAADAGLALDPEDLGCLNMRTQALARLGRKEEADRTIEKTLQLDPEDPFTHANTGWAMLRRGEQVRALDHFREALHRDPMNDYAKAGLVEALKARYWLYRMFLRYSLWVSSLSGRTQWFLILGLYFGARLLRGLAKSNPALEPLIMPVLALYFLFVISTWVIVPISNLLLRLNPYGRLALDKEETMTSNFIGGALLVALAGVLGWAVTGLGAFLTMAAFGVVMMMPLSSMLGKGRTGTRVLVGAAVLLGVLGALSVMLSFAGVEAASGLFVGFLIGAFAYQWLANYYAIRS